MNEKGSLIFSQVLLDSCSIYVASGATLEFSRSVILEDSAVHNEGGTIMGIATVNGTVRNDATIDGMTGNIPTKLHINGHLILGENSQLRFNIHSNTDHTSLFVKGNLTVNGKLWIYLQGGLVAEEGTELELLTVSGMFTGNFKSIYVVPTSEWDNINKCKNFTTSWDNSKLKMKFVACNSKSTPSPQKIEMIAFPVVALAIIVGGTIALVAWKKGFCNRIKFQRLGTEDDELDEFKISDN